MVVCPGLNDNAKYNLRWLRSNPPQHPVRRRQRVRRDAMMIMCRSGADDVELDIRAIHTRTSGDVDDAHHNHLII